MQLTILGNNSALPAYGRHPTAQFITINGESILIDCGESTQIQLYKYGCSPFKIKYILISHLHGDHYFGIFGLLSTMSLLGRSEDLYLFAPAPLLAMIETTMAVAQSALCYRLIFKSIDDKDSLLVDTRFFTISTFPVQHRIPCNGFIIETKSKGRKINPEACAMHRVPQAYYNKLKEGADYRRKDGTIVKNELVTFDGPATLKYAYCADTLYTETFLDKIKGADLLYHESTYLHDNAEKAKLRFHSTAKEAATLAGKAGVKKLLLGHFSSRYKELGAFYEEAAAVFPDVAISEEGQTYTLA